MPQVATAAVHQSEPISPASRVASACRSASCSLTCRTGNSSLDCLHSSVLRRGTQCVRVLSGARQPRCNGTPWSPTAAQGHFVRKEKYLCQGRALLPGAWGLEIGLGSGWGGVGWGGVGWGGVGWGRAGGGGVHQVQASLSGGGEGGEVEALQHVHLRHAQQVHVYALRRSRQHAHRREVIISEDFWIFLPSVPQGKQEKHLEYWNPPRSEKYEPPVRSEHNPKYWSAAKDPAVSAVQ